MTAPTAAAPSQFIENLFFASSSEPKGQLIPNLVGSVRVTCRSKIAKIHADRKSKMAAMVAILKIYFSLRSSPKPKS